MEIDNTYQNLILVAYCISSVNFAPAPNFTPESFLLLNLIIKLSKLPKMIKSAQY